MLSSNLDIIHCKSDTLALIMGWSRGWEDKQGREKTPLPHWMDLAIVSHASTSALGNYFLKGHLRVRTTNSFQTSSCFFVWWPPIVSASLSPGGAHWSLPGSLHLFKRLNETTSLSGDLFPLAMFTLMRTPLECPQLQLNAAAGICPTQSYSGASHTAPQKKCHVGHL